MAKDKLQFAIIGLGRFGGSVAKTLHQLGHEVLGIDSDPEIVQEFSTELTHVIAMDAHDEEALRSQGMHNFHAVVVAIGENVEANLFATLMLKDLGVKNVIVMANDVIQGRMLKKIGATQVVYPHADMGRRIAHKLCVTNMIDYMELGNELTIIELRVPDFLVGKNLKNAGMREKYGVNVVAVKTPVQIFIPPDPDMEMNKNDIVVIIGKHEGIKKLEGQIG